jgi:hypothetical protein
VREKGISSQLSKSDKWVSGIAKAAAECFSLRGYVETSMDDVAAGAGIGKMTVPSPVSSCSLYASFTEMVDGSLARKEREPQ